MAQGLHTAARARRLTGARPAICSSHRPPTSRRWSQVLLFAHVTDVSSGRTYQSPHALSRRRPGRADRRRCPRRARCVRRRHPTLPPQVCFREHVPRLRRRDPQHAHHLPGAHARSPPVRQHVVRQPVRCSRVHPRRRTSSHPRRRRRRSSRAWPPSPRTSPRPTSKRTCAPSRIRARTCGPFAVIGHCAPTASYSSTASCSGRALRPSGTRRSAAA